MAPFHESRLTHIQIVILPALLLIAGALIGHSIFVSPEVPFLTRGLGAEWVGAPYPTQSNAIPLDRENIPSTIFVRRFQLDHPPATAFIDARALRDAEFALNGILLVPDRMPRSWKETWRASVSEVLKPGGNELRVKVSNATGPPLLQLVLHRGGGIEDSIVQTNASWEAVLPDGQSGFANPALDTNLFPEALAVPPVREIATRNAPVLAGLFVASMILYATRKRWLTDERLRRLPTFTLAIVSVYWTSFFAFKVSQLPVMMGFDIPAHLAYIDILINELRLPLATEGWSTYHPPLFHFLTAVIVGVTGVGQEGVAAQIAYRIVCFAAGFGIVVTSALFARRFFANDPLRASLTIAFAGLLPMNLYMAAYVSNESLHACMASLAILFCVTLILRKRTTLQSLLRVGVALGLAILTRFTSFILVPILTLFVGTRVWLLDGSEERTAKASITMARMAIVFFTTALVGGWFYARNYINHDSFVVWNVNLPGSHSWWEQPGFHSADYYLGFGETLRHPFFSGFHSFADGVYSTFWGDGLVAGMIHLATRHALWNYDFMTLGYWLALPASALIFVGFARVVERAFRDSELRARLVWSLLASILFVLFFSLFWLTLRLPYYAQAKAFYILSATVPLSVVAAVGLSEIPRALAAPRFAALRILYFGWLGTLAGTLILSFLG